MSKRKGGILSLLVGVTLGAVGIFLSKKENRAKVKRKVTKVVNDPRTKAAVAKGKKEVKKVVAKGKKVANKVVAKARKRV